MHSRSERVFWLLIFTACLVRCVTSASLAFGAGCTTPDGTSGTCIKARECDRYMQTNKNLNETDTERDYSQALECGHIKKNHLPLVCCPTPNSSAYGDDCTTPRGAPGICIKAFECPYMLSIRFKKTISHQEDNYLQNLRCGFLRKIRVPLFCCPKHQNSPSCGIFPVTPMVADGAIVEPRTHPWLAMLIYINQTNQNSSLCSGSLITERHVLTAAHCLRTNANWTLRWVRFNEWNATSTENCTELNNSDRICRQDYEITSWVTHPEFVYRGNFPHDIAVIRLATNVAVSKYVRTICLPTTSEIRAVPVAGTAFRVPSWANSADSSKLQEVLLPGLPNTDCNTSYAKNNVTLTEKQLCVGGQKGEDTCHGDSGGPLVMDVNTTGYQIGLVSFGTKRCGIAGYPGVYTNVVSYLRWIESIIFDGLLL